MELPIKVIEKGVGGKKAKLLSWRGCWQTKSLSWKGAGGQSCEWLYNMTAGQTLSTTGWRPSAGALLGRTLTSSIPHAHFWSVL